MSLQSTAQSPWQQSPWQTGAILVARLIFAGVFAMAAAFKFAGMAETAGYIAAAGFPFPLFLAWCAAALVAAAYVIFLGFSFHGPGRWAGNQAEFGFFVDHFTFLAGLFFTAVHGPGGVLSLNRGWPGRA